MFDDKNNKQITPRLDADSIKDLLIFFDNKLLAL